MKQKIKEFINNRKNVPIILYLSSLNFYLKSYFSLTKEQSDEFEYSFDFLLVFHFFLDYYGLDKKDVDYDMFIDTLEENITEHDLNVISEYIDFVLYESEKKQEIIFLNHKLELAPISDIFVWPSGIIEFANNPVIYNKLIKYICNMEYTYKYKIIKKFQKINDLEKLTDIVSEYIYKIVFKFIKKITLRKYFKYDPLYKYIWACNLIELIMVCWINLTRPQNAPELIQYLKDVRNKRLTAATLMFMALN